MESLPIFEQEDKYRIGKYHHFIIWDRVITCPSRIVVDDDDI